MKTTSFNGGEMRRGLFAASVLVAASIAGLPVQAQTADSVNAELRQHEFDLAHEGMRFLLREAQRNDFFLLGELHGENEIPALIRELWPEMWKTGYRHIAIEASPWAADQLERGGSEIAGLWTQREADFVNSLSPSRATVLWGTDIEEEQPQRLIARLASANPANAQLRDMVAITAGGYRRETAPQLLALARSAVPVRDLAIGGVSLYDNIVHTFEVESDRLHADTRLSASESREQVMKSLFVARDTVGGPRGATANSKVMFRFGRNHLGRGYDRRGVSTLGNFVAEFAISRGLRAFNVGAFAAGGTYWWGGAQQEADERSDDPAFAMLASMSRYQASLFDLRPVRQMLHRMTDAERTPALTSLMYWADSYDAIICYRTVSPLRIK
jgi:hypothetical protein